MFCAIVCRLALNTLIRALQQKNKTKKTIDRKRWRSYFSPPDVTVPPTFSSRPRLGRFLLLHWAESPQSHQVHTYSRCAFARDHSYIKTCLRSLRRTARFQVSFRTAVIMDYNSTAITAQVGQTPLYWTPQGHINEDEYFNVTPPLSLVVSSDWCSWKSVFIVSHSQVKHPCLVFFKLLL